MIKIKDTEVFGFEAAIRGMRNPMNSWDKSDMTFDDFNEVNRIGNENLKLMKKLIEAGTDHSKFMRMINVTCDIIAPLYWWKEFDTYKIGTVRNSCSTMHTIHKKEFTLEDFSCEHIRGRAFESLKGTIELLNYLREKYIETSNKDYWYQIIQSLPSSYEQRATIQINYQVLRNIYHARKNHKLDEWRKFCEWIEELPYSELIATKSR